MKINWKIVGIALGVVAFFLVLSYGFMPQLLEGKIVNQADISGYTGMARESSVWNAQHPDDLTYWSDSMFGGMPTTAIDSQRKGDWTQPIYNFLLTGTRPASYLFIALLGAFLLFLALGVSWPLAVGGAVAIAFCSYNFQIIQVGHNTKMQAIAFMPWVLAALVYTYRSALGKAAEGTVGGAFARTGSRSDAPTTVPSAAKHTLKQWLPRVLLGASLFGLALSMQIKANHQQITYYLAILVFFYALVEFIHVIRSRQWVPFLVASALLLVLGVAGIATNTNKLLPLAKYTPHTMRGGSELNKGGDNEPSKGLDLDYATAWSYGWEELPNLMIPNFNGGASAGAVNPEKSATIQLLRRAGQKNLKETAKALPLYWGPQPFTAGPMYMGAITLFLFVLGLGLYKGREKWWLAAAVLIAVLMAVGYHFMAFTELCFKYLPLYNKFRTVSMSLVVLQVALPALGFLVLDRIVKESYERKTFLKAFWWALGLTGGFCLVAWLMPTLFGSFTSAADEGMQDILVDALVLDRIALFKADALRSFLLILASAVLLFWAFLPDGRKARLSRKWVAAGCICVLSAANLFLVGKRYLNADHFTTPKDFGKPFAERPVDNYIQADQDPHYRVLDLTVNVFNSSVPSYRYKSIGGYSPAKLQRYQDLIEQYLSQEITAVNRKLGQVESLEDLAGALQDAPVLNMLNTRYVVLDGQLPPLNNAYAFGPAWFVDKAVAALSPDDEIRLLGLVDPRTTAVVGQDMPMPAFTPAEGADDTIEMESYAPNALRYRYKAAADRLAVFSEIYYPNGWTATVDGEPLELFRADWTLRAALLPAGEHTVEMRFDPPSYRVGAAVSRASSIPLILISLLSLGWLLVGACRRKEQTIS